MKRVSRIALGVAAATLIGVIGDLLGRRGQVQGQDTRGNAQVITAMVPLASMFNYVINLHSMTQGRATYVMEFDHYAQVPKHLIDGDDPRFPGAAAMRVA
jgi:translation elongation factor EF-G